MPQGLTLALLALAVVLTAALNHMLPASSSLSRGVVEHLYYLPIVLGVIVSGPRGGVGLAALTCVCLLIAGWAGPSGASASELARSPAGWPDASL